MHSACDMPNAHPLRRLGDLLVIAAFALSICLPLLRGPEELDAAESRRLELRELAAAPAAPHDWQGLLTFPDAFSKWYDDHFGYRRNLVRGHMLLQGRVLGVSPSPRVELGTDGWLYFTDSGIFEDFRGEQRLGAAALRDWQLRLEERRDWLQQRGVQFVFAVAPNKPTIYPQHLPERLQHPGKTPRLDQLLTHFAQHSDFAIVDLRGPLRELAQERLAYLITDSHWNQLGAFRAYQEVAATLVAKGVPMTPLQPGDFTVAFHPARGDLGLLLPELEIPPESHPFLEPKQPLPCRKIELPASLHTAPASWHMWEPPTAYECPGQEGVLLMFKDSFAYPQMRWFACHFRYSFFLSMRAPEQEALQTLLDVTRATVVIEQRVERNLSGKPPPPLGK